MKHLLSCILLLVASIAIGQTETPRGLTLSDLQGVSIAENITIDSTGVFVRFGEASARLSFSQEVELTVNGLSCTFEAVVFLLSLHPVTVVGIGEQSDYVQVCLEDGRMFVELEGNYLTFSN